MTFSKTESVIRKTNLKVSLRIQQKEWDNWILSEINAEDCMRTDIIESTCRLVVYMMEKLEQVKNKQ
jgi:hypothetical protein